MIAAGLSNLLDTARREKSAGVVAAMVATIPEGTLPDDAEIAKALLAAVRDITAQLGGDARVFDAAAA